MADFSIGSWFGLLFRKKPQATDPKAARRGYEFARHVYNETGGATPELKRLHREYMEKQRGRLRPAPVGTGRLTAVPATSG